MTSRGRTNKLLKLCAVASSSNENEDYKSDTSDTSVYVDSEDSYKPIGDNVSESTSSYEEIDIAQIREDETYDAFNTTIPFDSDLNTGLEEVDQENVPVRYKRKRRKSIKGRSRKIRKTRKENRNLGKSYVTESGKQIAARKFKSLDVCRQKCKERFTDVDRLNIFHEYWQLGSSSKRSAYISGLIVLKETDCHRKKVLDQQNHRNRNWSRKYYLRVNGALVPICAKCFLLTFNEKQKFVSLVISKMLLSTGGIIEEDKRGKNIKYNKHTQKTLDEVKQFILSIPSYESHYSRRHSEKRYLPSFHTISSLYQEYKVKHFKPVGRPTFEQIFHELNLSIKVPKLDTCNKCDTFNIQINGTAEGEERETLIKSLKDHQNEAELAYTSKAYDKNEAKEIKEKKVLTFDMQQCLPTPKLETNVVFYKRQLWVYNLTVHDCDDNQAYCYMWSEVDGGRGANQIASCIMKHLSNISSSVKQVTLYSDTCGGQNKNSHMMAMYMSCIKNHENIEIIDHKFLVAGHTHLECDIDHALIEKKKKNSKTPIYHPHDWLQLVRQTGKKNPFQVIEMTMNDFFSFSELLKSALNTKKFNDNGEKFVWKDIKWLRFTKNVGVLLYKDTLNADVPFKTISLLRKGHARSNLLPPLTYTKPVPISVKKKKDLIELLPLIPTVFHHFYQALPTDSQTKDTLPDDDVEENSE